MNTMLGESEFNEQAWGGWSRRQDQMLGRSCFNAQGINLHFLCKQLSSPYYYDDGCSMISSKYCWPKPIAHVWVFRLLWTRWSWLYSSGETQDGANMKPSLCQVRVWGPFSCPLWLCPNTGFRRHGVWRCRPNASSQSNGSWCLPTFTTQLFHKTLRVQALSFNSCIIIYWTVLKFNTQILVVGCSDYLLLLFAAIIICNRILGFDHDGRKTTFEMAQWRSKPTNAALNWGTATYS